MAPAARDEATDATTAPAAPQGVSPAVGRGLDFERISLDESVHRAMVRQELAARSLYRSPFQINNQTVEIHAELCRTRISTIAAVAAVIAAAPQIGAGERGSASASPELGFAGRGPRHDYYGQVNRLIELAQNEAASRAAWAGLRTHATYDIWQRDVRALDHARRNLLAVLQGAHQELTGCDEGQLCPECAGEAQEQADREGKLARDAAVKP